ncbi:hypothetical protein [Robinsoniella peoriensis]|nr:hypothetical protein [Robinsoniella peoriensis]
MEEFLNIPELTETITEDICNVYKELQDIKAVARQYCVPVKEVKLILNNN